MYVTEQLFIEACAILAGECLQDCATRFFNTPMLVVYDISQSLKEGNRGIGIKQPSLKLLPIAAMQIFRYEYSTIIEMSKIMRK